jgi:hypothetical protein
MVLEPALVGTSSVVYHFSIFAEPFAIACFTLFVFPCPIASRTLKQVVS